MATVPKPLVLAILDGWGLAVPSNGNAISLAKTPNMTAFWQKYAHTQLIAHGESVGLPRNEAGNTETGHLNIGAGRIVYQDLPRINLSIADGSFFQNGVLSQAFQHVKTHSSDLHIMGLVGGGGVHSDLSHLFALLRLCREQQVSKVFLHVFTDGRDSPPNAAMTYISQIQKLIDQDGIGQFASVMGRYYAMDRDFRWDRTAKAYWCLTRGEGKLAPTIAEAVRQAYATNQTDEFIEPCLMTGTNGRPIAQVKGGDAVIFYNFRIDRPRQLAKAFVLDNFEADANKVDFDPYAVKYLKTHAVTEKMVSERMKPFARGAKLTNLFFVTMTQYEKNLPCLVAFPPQQVDMPLGEVLARANLTQLRVAESEKERFVTYYFNGQREASFEYEDRLIIPSPRVSTYDKRPEMSAREITQHVLQHIRESKYAVVVINYANADMVGHTGNIAATSSGCSVVDECLGQLAAAILAAGGVLIITADHGNAEEMLNRSTGGVDTEHNANPVPFILVGNDFANGQQLSQGTLADVAPTLLGLLQIPSPLVMTGRNLLK